MSYEFTETVTLTIPNIEAQLVAFSEAQKTDTHKGLIVEIASIHAGRTSNHNHYSAEELEKAVESWVTPYPKPVIMNHDPASEPVGRVMAAKMDTEEDGTPFIRLQAAITDPSAMEKIADGRYLTGSIGGKADEALCSICGENWAKASASAFSTPACKHVRGRNYKGKDAYIEMKNLSFKEYSWVNMPADGKSGVRAPAAKSDAPEGEEAEEDWIRPARFYGLSMDTQEVMEYTESESRDVLSGLRKKDAAPLYMQLKGAFLSALAVHESEEDAVDEDVIMEEEEDILAVSEGLSQDLAQTVTEDETPEPEADVEEEGEVEDSDSEPDAEEGVDQYGDQQGGSNAPLPRRGQGQEKPHVKDIDAETSQYAPRNRQSDDEENVVVEAETPEIELSEQIEALESRVEELTAQQTILSEENARLRSALKRGLVERVVDAKVGLDMVQRSDREAEIEEHLKRSASSLADSLRDLAGMVPVTKAIDYSQVPRVEGQGVVGNVKDTKGREKVFTITPEELEQGNKLDAEAVFTDALMGRRKL